MLSLNHLEILLNHLKISQIQPYLKMSLIDLMISVNMAIWRYRIEIYLNDLETSSNDLEISSNDLKIYLYIYIFEYE